MFCLPKLSAESVEFTQLFLLKCQGSYLSSILDRKFAKTNFYKGFYFDFVDSSLFVPE